MIQTLKDWGDGLSFAAIAAVIFGALPQITAVLSFVYVLIRLWETELVRGWRGIPPTERRRDKKG